MTTIDSRAGSKIPNRDSASAGARCLLVTPVEILATMAGIAVDQLDANDQRNDYVIPS